MPRLKADIRISIKDFGIWLFSKKADSSRFQNTCVEIHYTYRFPEKLEYIL